MKIRKATTEDLKTIANWATQSGLGMHQHSVASMATPGNGTVVLVLTSDDGVPIYGCTVREGFFNFIFRSPTAPRGCARDLAAAAVAWLFALPGSGDHIEAGGPFSQQGDRLLDDLGFKSRDIDGSRRVQLTRQDWTATRYATKHLDIEDDDP